MRFKIKKHLFPINHFKRRADLAQEKDLFSREEKGYALVTVLLLFLVISVLLMSLLELTVNSHSSVAAQENILRARVNAENGALEAFGKIKEGINQINNQGNQEIGTIKSKITQLLGSIRPDANNTALYTYTLSWVEKADGQNGPLIEEVTIQATGMSGGRTEKYTKTILISTIADVFRYAVVTPGDLYLNGAAYLDGDLYVKGNLTSHNQASFVDGNTYWVDTAYPAINGNLTLEGDLMIRGRNGSSSRTKVPLKEMNNYFSIPPKLKNVPLNLQSASPVDQAFADPGNTSMPTYSKQVKKRSYYFNSNQIISESTRYSNNDFIIGSGVTITVFGNLIVDESFEMRNGAKLIVNGDLYIGGNAALTGDIELSEGRHVYIGSNATINNLTFKGTMFVNGNLEINQQLKANSAIYVKENIDVNELNNEGGGTLILLSKGNTLISNNNLYQDEPKEIDAYFYSDSQLTIYGVGSNLKINGGIYGSSITLNATKGRTEEEQFYVDDNGKRTYAFFVGNWYGGHYFDPRQLTLPPTKSRLSIYYKKEMILNPPSGIPTVSSVTITEVDEGFE